MDWYRERNIGGGSFGTVEKWKNDSTGETVAVKIAKDSNIDEDLWIAEIDQLRTISHVNIVGTRAVPSEVRAQINSRLPILCMEFCGGGSLRDLLRAPANRCGLPPGTALDVWRDIGAGVEYLHARKVMHRDLKPENVVLSGPPAPPAATASASANPEHGRRGCPDPDNSMAGVTYKLIDLGYAKNLQEQSMANSFVGTQPYLPPEMFIADCQYSYPAEYWSLGNVIFECVVGKRPFFVNMQKLGIATWYEHVRRKGEDAIYGVMDANRGKTSVSFSSTLPETCSMRAPYRQALELWLKSVLQFDGSKRGGYRKGANRPGCFELLERILAIRAINVFYVPGYTTYSYSFDELGDSVLRLQECLARETGVEIANQILLSGTGGCVSEYESISKAVEDVRADQCWAFLMPSPEAFSLPWPRTPVAGLVQIVLQDPTSLLPTDKRKQAFEEGIHLAHQMFAACQRLMQAQKSTLLALMRVALRVKQAFKRGTDTAQQVQFFSSFLRLNAADHLAQLRAVVHTLPAHMKPAANALEQELSHQCDMLAEWDQEDFELHELLSPMTSMQRRVAALQRHRSALLPQCDEMFVQHVREAENLFRDLQSKADVGAADTQTMCRVLTACSTDFGRIAEGIQEHWQDMLQAYDTCVEHLSDVRDQVKSAGSRLAQLEDMRCRQLQVWRFVASPGGSSNSSSSISSSIGSSSSSSSSRQRSGMGDHAAGEVAGERPDPVIDYHGQVRPAAAAGVTRSSSGTVRELSEFLQGKLLMENSAGSGESVLRESEALLGRVFDNAAAGQMYSGTEPPH